jgi:hypothetical protein
MRYFAVKFYQYHLDRMALSKMETAFHCTTTSASIHSLQTVHYRTFNKKVYEYYDVLLVSILANLFRRKRLTMLPRIGILSILKINYLQRGSMLVSCNLQVVVLGVQVLFIPLAIS